MDLNDNIEFDFDFNINEDISNETPYLDNETLQYKVKAKNTKTVELLKKEKLKTALNKLPLKNEYIHLISNGCYDYFTFIPTILDLIDYADELICSTWTMNRINVESLFKLFDKGQIKKIDIITGLYFKRRESAVYAKLIEGLKKRKQRYKSLKNHAKIILLGNFKSNTYVVIEGSANFTANPRIEQNIITNNKGLYNFHKRWITDIIEKNHEQEIRYDGI